MLIVKSMYGMSFIVITALLTACGGSDESPPKSDPSTPTITLIKYYEVPQCMPPRITPALLKKELADVEIDVIASSCPFQSGIAIAASCDAPLPRYFMIDIAKNKENNARTLGYRELSSFPALTASACTI